MRGGGGSLVILPVQRPSLCTSLTGVKCVCAKGLWLWWGRGLRLCCLWRGFLYVAPSDG